MDTFNPDSGKLEILDEELVFAPPHSDVSFAIGDSDKVETDVGNGFVSQPASLPLRVTSSESDVSIVNIVVDAGEEAVEELYRGVIADVKERMREHDLVTISPSTLPVLIGIVMEAIEHTIIKGNAQTVFAVRIVSDLIDELPEGPEKVFMKTTAAGGGVEGTIELVVAASRGKLNVNRVADAAMKTCAAPCLDYLIAKIRRCKVPRCKVPRCKVPRCNVPRCRKDKKSE